MVPNWHYQHMLDRVPLYTRIQSSLDVPEHARDRNYLASRMHAEQSLETPPPSPLRRLHRTLSDGTRHLDLYA